MKTAKNAIVPQIFTTYDIGRMTGTDPTTVHKWIDKGLLRGYRTPGGHRRVRAEDLRSFLSSHRMPIPKELGGSDTLRVMIVDPEGESLRSVSKALRRLKPSWDVISLDSGVEALLRFSADLPDVLVFDLAVSDADGLQIFRKVHQNPETSSVKVVAVASRGGAEFEKKAVAAGATACLRKPLPPQDLADAIESAIGLQPGFALA